MKIASIISSFKTVTRLVLYAYVWLPRKFKKSRLKKTLFKNEELLDRETTLKFHKNLKSIGIFNFWYQTLHRKKLSANDLENTFYYPLLWTLQDDHTDATDSKNTSRFELMKKGKEDLSKRVPNPHAFETVGNKLVEVQMASQIQKDKDVSLQQLEKAEDEKAGFSFPFYSTLVNFEPVERQFHILYNFGVLLQHIDDVLDIYEDTHEGIRTVADTLAIEEFEQFFMQKVNTFLAQLKSINASENCVTTSIICLSIGLVQINNIKRLAVRPGFSYDSAQRAEMICDMRKWKNIKMHYLLSYNLFEQYKAD